MPHCKQPKCELRYDWAYLRDDHRLVAVDSHTRGQKNGATLAVWEVSDRGDGLAETQARRITSGEHLQQGETPAREHWEACEDPQKKKKNG